MSSPNSWDPRGPHQIWKRSVLSYLLEKRVKSPGIYVERRYPGGAHMAPEWKVWFVPSESADQNIASCQRQEGPAAIHLDGSVDWIKDDEVQVSRFYKEGN